MPPECKNGCVGRPAVDSRGMYAGLCAECKEAKRAARASKVAVEKGRIVPVPDDRVHWLDVTGGGHGDPGWLEEHAALVELHREKSSTYGTGDDALHNFATVGVAAHKSPERYVVERIIEKCVRALNMIDAGAADHVKEYRDIASLGLVAAALQRRRAT